MANTPLNQPKVLNAWCMYDWANSVYGLVIRTTIFPIYFTNATRAAYGSDQIPFFGQTIKHTVLLSWTWSISFLLVAIIIPILSGIADYQGTKKRFMQFFTIMGSAACVALFFFSGNNVEFGVIMCILATMGFTGGLVFYNAFLPEIATEDRYDRLSARGFALGYIGSLILLIINLVMITFAEDIGITKGMASKISFVMVGLWWIGFAQLAFIRLPQGTAKGGTLRENMLKGYREFAKVWRSLGQQKMLRTYLVSFFFFSMGIQTTMYMAALFGKDEIKMEDNSLILVIIILQVVAILGGYLFAWLSERRGNKLSLFSMLIIWIGICFSAAYLVYTPGDFYILAFFVGLVMGGLQSLSRSSYSKLIPKDTKDYASYFSFFDVSEKIAAVLGTFSYGLVEAMTQSMRNSAAVLGIYFVLGMIFLVGVRFTKGQPEDLAGVPE